MISRADLRMLSAPNYFWPSFYIAADWAAIIGAAVIAGYWSHPVTYILAVLFIGGRQHALFVMIHEGVHKHIARSKGVNDMMASWLAAFPLFFDMHKYRASHLKHHENLNTDLDPDWVRKRVRKEWQFPVSKKSLMMFIPYFLLFWGPVEWAMIIGLYSGLLDRETYQNPLARSRFIQKLIFYSSAACIITALGAWMPILLYWLVPLFLVFPPLQRMRSVAEHFGLKWTNDVTSSRDVLCSPIESSFFGPHFVNYHLCHHLYAAVPCYRLRELRLKLMENAEFRAHAHANSTYIGPGNSVLSDLTSPRSAEAPKQIDLLKAS